MKKFIYYTVVGLSTGWLLGTFFPESTHKFFKFLGVLIKAVNI
jgi:hypothetical protein